MEASVVEPDELLLPIEVAAVELDDLLPMEAAASDLNELLPWERSFIIDEFLIGAETKNKFLSPINF